MWNTETDNESKIEEEYNELDVLDEKPRRRIRRTKVEKETDEYVSKEEMWNELFNYYISLREEYDWETQKLLKKESYPKISNRLTTIISDIATKMGYRGNFCSYSWIDEMIGDATLKMVKAIRDCSFKCYTIAEIISRTEDNGTIFISFIDKKGEAQKKQLEDTDFFFSEDNKDYIKFKANPFGYFSRITSHSYLNRIKKEKLLEETKRNFQTETWEKLYADENFRNVRRPKYVENDENDVIVEE
jgi:hypothetical protein